VNEYEHDGIIVILMKKDEREQWDAAVAHSGARRRCEVARGGDAKEQLARGGSAQWRAAATQRNR